jgi:uncharacterized membrane protein
MRRRKEVLPEKAEKELEGVVSLRARTHLMEERQASFKLEDGTLIRGKINIFAEPAHQNSDLYVKNSADVGTFYWRISDIFTKGSNPFIVVSDVALEGQEGRVLVINKNKVIWVSPED